MSDEKDDQSTFVVLRGADDTLEADDAAVFVAFIPVKNQEARDLVIDPLPLLATKLPQFGIEEGWRITVNRVDADIPIHNPGPHHILVAGLVLQPLRQVHCTVHRSLKDR
jgi:hypothetical protein